MTTNDLSLPLEPQRMLGTGCCEPRMLPRLDDAAAAAAAALLKALADPARLQIIDLLSRHGGAVCVCDLEGVVGLPDADGQRPRQATVSHHLRVLREAGLIGSTKQGQWAYYFVVAERLVMVQSVLERLR